MNWITLEHLSKIYHTEQRDYPIFRDLCLKFPLGQITVVVGRSGCGKSTLLRLLDGQEQPDSGRITMPEDFRSTMLSPQPYLITWASVLTNLTLACGAGLTPGERESRARELMALVRLSDDETLTPPQLSTGMKQRLALARALATRSQLLLMDEPFASLDFLTRAELQQELLRIQQESPRTIVFVTHQLEEAVLMADQIVVIQGGGTALQFPVEDLPTPRSQDSPAFAQWKARIMDACRK